MAGWFQKMARSAKTGLLCTAWALALSRTRAGQSRRAALPAGLLGLELGPAGVQSIHLRLRGLERLIAGLERRRIGGDGGILSGAPAGLDGALRFRDRVLHAVPL